MQSAAIIAEKAAAEAAAATTVNGNKSAADTLSSSSSTIATVITTPGAIVKDGEIYLRGNPLQTTPEILCPNCKLPRLLHPITGNGSQPNPDPTKEYCAERPFISKPGHDIHGNLFPTDKAVTKTPKPRKNGNGKASETKPTPPSSSDTLTASPPDADTDKVSIPPEQEKAQVALNTFPTVKCPNCPRSLIVTRIAQHLDKCLGLSSRQSSRTATRRMTETPRESRVGTPSATGMGKRKYAEEDTDEDDLPKKKKKKRIVKKKAMTKPAAAAKKAEAKKKPVSGKTTTKKTAKDKLCEEDVDKGLETGSLEQAADGLGKGAGEDAIKDGRKDLTHAAGKKVRKTPGKH